MSMERYTLGLDFGTESARAILVGVATGEEVAQAVVEYPHGVITDELPHPEGKSVPLERDWALQDPEDYLEVLRQIVPQVLKESGAKREQVIGIGVDFTSCTVMPVARDGTPLCSKPEFRGNPHSWVKLWKHHAADPYAREIMTKARDRQEAFLKYYGGTISSEWLLPKALQLLREAPKIYGEAAFLVEGGDWIVWRLAGKLVRNATAAGYKALRVDGLGYPSDEFLAAVDPQLAGSYAGKLAGPVLPAGERAGGLVREWARTLGLKHGTPVSVAIIDAHAGVPGAGVVEPGTMLIVMGTSTCHMLLSERCEPLEGICGVVKDGIIKGYYGYESGQAASGDIYAWFVENCASADVVKAAEAAGRSVHEELTERAGRLRPGESGLVDAGSQTDPCRPAPFARVSWQASFSGGGSGIIGF